MTNNTRVWFITGVSGGLGRALAKEVAAAGNIVVGTVRKTEQLEEFNILVPGKTFAVQLDVTRFDEIQKIVEDVLGQFNKIDVLVNNAGYGLFGSIEEVSMDEARKQMDTNFFGALAMTQAVLPVMRNQKSGNVVQISSMAGFRSMAGMGLYNASKFALEGFSEALYYEAAPLNIKVTIVEPGPFRTDWAGASSSRAQKRIAEYTQTAGERIDIVTGYSGNQPGDPVKAAKAIIKAVESENPPLRLPLGQQAIEAIRNKIKLVEQDVASWEEISVNTAF